MNLRSQTYTIIGIPFLILLIILIIASWFMVRGSFQELERQHAQTQVRQILVHLDTLVNQVAQTTRDWATWDDTYRFVRDGNQTYRRDNLNDPTLVNLDLNALVFVDLEGRVAHSLGWDGAARRRVPVMPGLLELLHRRGDLLRMVLERGPVKGIASLPGAPVALSMHPILKSDDSGPAAGVLVMARTMREVDLGHIQEMFGARLEITRSKGGAPARAGASGPAAITVSPLNAHTVAGITSLPGLPGEDPISLTVTMPRNVYQLGEKTTIYFLGWLALTALVMGAAAGYVLNQRVIKRLTALTGRVGDITRSEDQSLRLPVSGADELAGLALSVNQMLSALQEAHQEAARSARRYQGILEDQTELICRFDRKHRLTFANEAFRRYFSLPLEHVPGGSLEALLPPEGLNKMQALLDTLGDGNGVADEYIQVENNDGSPAWLHVTVRAISDQDGRVGEYQMMGLDATEQLRAVRALKDSEARYRTLFERAGESIFIIEGEGDQIGRIVAANATALRVFGYTAEEFTRLNVADLVPPNLAAGVADTLRRMMRGSWASRELPHRTKQGVPLIMEVSAGPVELGGRNYLLAFVRDITERKKAQEQLEEREQWYRTTFEHTGTAMSVIEADGTFSRVNEHFARLMGLPREEIEGRLKWSDTVAPEDLERLRGYRRQRFQGEDIPRQYEFTFLNSRGDRRHALVSVALIPGTTTLISSMHDITESKEAQKQLEERERWYRTTLEHTGTAMLVIDETNIVVMCNEKFADLVGHPRESIEGKFNWHRMVSPVDLPRMKEYHDRRMRGEQAPTQYEFTFRDRWDHERDVLISVQLIPGTTNKVCSLLDITERKKAENALRESEARLRAILEANPDPAVVYDNQGRVTYLNPAFTSIFGWSFEELSGQRIDFVPEDQRDKSLGQIKMLYETGTPANFETVRFTKQGRRLEVHISAAGISAPDGGVAGMVVNITDITERKRMSAQLLRSQKMEAVGNLAGGIAHDFNNVLQVIRGYAQLAVWESGASRGLGSYATEIEKAASRGADLVQRLLAFSRKLDPELKPVDLNREVSDAALMLERIIPKMIGITTRLAEDLDIIDADPTQLEQILLNLGTNARDAMPGGGALTMETENLELDEAFCSAHPPLQPGRYVLLTVSDTGQGMDPEVRDHIFEPFFTTKVQGEGTGMGLASVYGIVEAHHGYIECYSEPGQGTVFRIYLPARAAQRGQSPEPVVEPQTLPGGDETVLLVDDEPGVREIGRMMLTKCGYTVLSAPSGETALEMLAGAEKAPELVILDLNMPGMGGRRCLEEIKRLNPDLPVVVASGYTDTGQVDKILAAGAAAFVGKPFRLHRFLNTVRDILDQAGKSRNPGDQERLSRSM